jgi:hypothetical protein
MTYLPDGWQADPKRRRSATAANFAAALELAKAGQGADAPVRDLRPDPAAPEGGAVSDARQDTTPRPFPTRDESLFRAPPLAEQERMVEAMLFASADP